MGEGYVLPLKGDGAAGPPSNSGLVSAERRGSAISPGKGMLSGFEGHRAARLLAVTMMCPSGFYSLLINAQAFTCGTWQDLNSC